MPATKLKTSAPAPVVDPALQTRLDRILGVLQADRIAPDDGIGPAYLAKLAERARCTPLEFQEGRRLLFRAEPKAPSLQQLAAAALQKATTSGKPAAMQPQPAPPRPQPAEAAPGLPARYADPVARSEAAIRLLLERGFDFACPLPGDLATWVGEQVGVGRERVRQYAEAYRAEHGIPTPGRYRKRGQEPEPVPVMLAEEQLERLADLIAARLRGGAK